MCVVWWVFVGVERVDWLRWWCVWVGGVVNEVYDVKVSIERCVEVG